MANGTYSFAPLYTGIPDVIYRDPPPGGRHRPPAPGVAYGKPVRVQMPNRRYMSAMTDDSESSDDE